MSATGVRLALVVPGGGAASPLAERLRRIAPRLAEGAQVQLFGPGEGDLAPGQLPLERLRPRSFDQVLWACANERSFGYLPRWLARVGGTVVLESFELGELARAASPALGRGGLAGFAAALRHGGLGEALRLRSGRGAGSCLLNRAVVRLADGFVVRGEELRALVLAERNAPTPIAVLDDLALEDDALLARELLARLAHFPAHRTNRKSLVRTAIELSDRARAESEERRRAESATEAAAREAEARRGKGGG